MTQEFFACAVVLSAVIGPGISLRQNSGANPNVMSDLQYRRLLPIATHFFCIWFHMWPKKTRVLLIIHKHLTVLYQFPVKILLKHYPIYTRRAITPIAELYVEPDLG
jgi:hypothetical protein